ncbi:MAG TPA: hypothetical protein PKD99_17235 [Sphingopyxis sp.]|nr:hypothetical protein [Sphingopyxis sp.]HMP46844.1 hypothetical protein [Sphingopyxis sp.]HMQ18894.1 hypothetical protein [Sphingopyxis sp.]
MAKNEGRPGKGTKTGDKSWTKPSVRAILPAQRTRGGGSGQNDQDDANYDLS